MPNKTIVSEEDRCNYVRYQERLEEEYKDKGQRFEALDMEEINESRRIYCDVEEESLHAHGMHLIFA